MLNNSKGFSLIELMVVVSILSILAAISVPEYQKYRRKSKQVAAKSQLVSIYTAQQMFRAKHKTFFPNLWAIGFEPHGVVNYRASFNTGSSSYRSVQGYTSSPYSPTLYADTNDLCGSSYANGISAKCMSSDQTEGTPTLSQIGTVRNSFVTGTSSFVIGTASVLQGQMTTSASDDSIDIWTMNHRRELENIANGAL